MTNLIEIGRVSLIYGGERQTDIQQRDFWILRVTLIYIPGTEEPGAVDY